MTCDEERCHFHSFVPLAFWQQKQQKKRKKERKENGHEKEYSLVLATR